MPQKIRAYLGQINEPRVLVQERRVLHHFWTKCEWPEETGDSSPEEKKGEGRQFDPSKKCSVMNLHTSCNIGKSGGDHISL